MNIIVPLAGPDTYNPKYGIKPLIDINGVPLIEKALKQRSWYSTDNNFIFILIENPQTENLKSILSKMFNSVSYVTLKDYTKGALLSSLAGSALIHDFDKSVVFDLIDILFEGNVNVTEIFNHTGVGGILPCFKSNSADYSYATVENGYVTKTREKLVISDHASAGVYFFKNFEYFLTSVAYSIRNQKDLSVRNNLFLCPAMNGLIENNLKVAYVEVKLTKSISSLIKEY